jgi:hypothetical protein
MQCKTCKISGGNMKRCKKCNNIWCINCCRAGKGDYPHPKQYIGNKCPYCGALDQMETPK